MNFRNRFVSVLAFTTVLAGLALVASQPAQAISVTWDAGGGGGAITNGAGVWLAAGFWNNAGAAATWTSGDDATFGGPATAGGAVTLASPTTANTVTFSPSFTGTYTLGTAGQTLTISNGITMNASAGAATIVSPITLGGAQTWTNNSANTLTISGAVSNGGNTLTVDGSGFTNLTTALAAGAGGLTKTGSGRLQLSNANQLYTGATIVSGGVLSYGDTSAQLSAANITLNGGVIDQRWTTLFNRTLGAGANQIQLTGGASGFSNNNGSHEVRLNNSTAFEVVWGSASFNPSTLVLQSAFTQNNTNILMSNLYDLNASTRTIQVNPGIGGASTATFSNVIRTSTGTAGISKTGNGILILSGAGGANTYNGGTTINAGQVRFDTRNSMPATGTVTVADGATLGVTVAGTGTTWGAGTGVAGIAGLTSTSNSGNGFGGQTGAVVNFDGNSFLNLNVVGNVTESNAIGNGTATSIGLIKSGSSALTLSGNNGYTGGTQFVGGTLSAGHANAIGTTGDLTFRGGALQYTAASAGNDYGSRIKNSTSAITLDTNSQNVTISGIANTNTGGLTKNGAGTLTFTGANTYTGATTINAGTVVLNNDGDVTGGAVVFAGNNTGLTVTGGSGVTSIWNLNGGNFETSDGTFSNVQVLIDGAGTAASARVINVGILEWGRTAINSTLTLTNGGQMNVNGEIRIGNPYYSETGGANVTIGGGTATSTFTGNTGQDFYIGYGERTGSKNNVVTVNSGGVLTNIRDMYVGHINNAQNNDNPTTNNQLLVTGGTASMRGLTLGYIQTDTKDALANVVAVTSGGQLSTTGVSYIGRANNATSTSNGNTMTISGTGSSWNAGNQNVLVGFTNNASAQSNNNILTVGTGGSVTGVNALTVGSGTGTETGNQLVVNGSLSATTVTVSAGNTLAGSGTITGAVTVNGLLLPGNSPGLLTINTSLALSASSDSLFELGGTTLGTLYDNITLSGTATALTYGGDLSVLNYLAYDMDASSYTYDLFSWGAVTPSGNFASVTVNSVALSQSGSQWMGVNGLASYLFDQATGDLSITVVPEPSSLAMLAFGMLSMWLFRRK